MNRVTLRVVDFANQGEFFSYLMKHKVDGDYSMLWQTICLYGKITVTENA